MNYYHDLITEKSWKLLQELKRKYSFILIGGWAVYLYTKALKSHDIDIICRYEELEKLRMYYGLAKNDRLRKYEIHVQEIDIDIYVPFFSELGIPAEDLLTMAREREGFTVLEPEPLLILKQKAYRERSHSLKGEKDKIDIISLLNHAVDIEKYLKLLQKCGLDEYRDDLKLLFSTMREVVELGLKEHAFAKLKRKIMDML